MNQLFSLPAAALLAIVASFGLITFVLAVAYLHWFSRRSAATGPVAPFFTAVTTLWALSFSFAAADIWAANSEAARSASAERSAITRLAGIAHENALDIPRILDALAAYKKSVAEEEWGHFANGQPSPAADAALQDIRLAIVGAARGGSLDGLLSKIVQDFDELQDARNARLAIGRGAGSDYKWYLVLALTLLSQIAIASVHADRPRAGRGALAIYTLAASVSLWIIALHANPYVGVSKLEYARIHVEF